jgi:hypothetical protein
MKMTGLNIIDLSNRSGKDRRTKSGFNICSLFFGSKREKIRRQEDIKKIGSNLRLTLVEKYKKSNVDLTPNLFK